jgi:hypothetical protein
VNSSDHRTPARRFRSVIDNREILMGSANVTAAALGLSPRPNLELVALVTPPPQELALFLAELRVRSRPATDCPPRRRCALGWRPARQHGRPPSVSHAENPRSQPGTCPRARGDSRPTRRRTPHRHTSRSKGRKLWRVRCRHVISGQCAPYWASAPRCSHVPGLRTAPSVERPLPGSGS